MQKQSNHELISILRWKLLWANHSRSVDRQTQGIWPFPSYLVPLFQNESSRKTFLIKMSLICMIEIERNIVNNPSWPNQL